MNRACNLLPANLACRETERDRRKDAESSAACNIGAYTDAYTHRTASIGGSGGNIATGTETVTNRRQQHG